MKRRQEGRIEGKQKEMKEKRWYDRSVEGRSKEGRNEGNHGMKKEME